MVENLIRFMVAFYGMGELYHMSGRLTSEAAESKVIREGIEYPATMEAFRSAYAAFLPNDEITMHEILRLVPNLIATSASAHELVDILLSDRDKSGTLVPLIVALRQHTGEEVRAPVEILEVAADIRERIKVRAAKDAPVPS